VKLALVFNPFSYQPHEENLRVVQRYFGTFPPLSLAWVAAIAEKHGHEVRIIDARTLGLSPEETVGLLKDYQPDIVGFTVTIYAYPETLSWIRHVKKEMGCPVIVGGFGVGLYPTEVMASPDIDFGFVGHVHDSLPMFLKEWGGDQRYSMIPGLMYRENGELKQGPLSPPRFDFNVLPIPARHLLPNDLYASFPTQRKNFTVMVTSLGCPFECVFCANSKTPFSARSPRLVLQELEECYHTHHVREVDFFDYDLATNRQNLMEMCRGIVQKGLDISWACRARVTLVDEELLHTMQQAGCYRIYYGIESGVQSILDQIRKGISLDQIRKAVSMTKRAGIDTLGYFMVGNIGETRETVRQSVRFAKSLGLDYVQFSKMTAKPATKIYADYVRDTGHDYWRDYVLGKTEAKALPHPWTALTQEEIDQLTKWAYVSFHSRFGYLVRNVLKIRSWGEFKRKVKAYLEMLITREDSSDEKKPFDIYRDARGR